MILPRTSCRSCHSALVPILSLGAMVPSTFLPPDVPDPPARPLALMHCAACGLVQLQHTVDPEQLYRQYWYLSGTNDVMRAELGSVVTDGLTHLGRTPRLVVDVGANDGTLLSWYNPATTSRVAYEPAFNLYDRLRPHAEFLIPDFFPPREPDHRLLDRSVDVLTSIAMFYDLDDPHACVAEVDRLLADDGVWIVQFQDLAQMINTHAFDNIGHEHLCYYSLETFRRLLLDADLAVQSVERRAINGGSLRVCLRRKAYLRAGEDRIVARRQDEEALGTNLEALERFAWQVEQIRGQVHALIAARLTVGPIDLYAASTKSSTLLQYCGLDHTVIRQAVERTPEKVGLVTSGTRIPIIEETTWRKDPAPTTLIGAWQFAEYFMDREAGYGVGGGQWLLPLPTVRLVRTAKEVMRHGD